MSSLKALDDNQSVDLFKTLLRFRTVSQEGPRGSYQECAKWIQAQCEELGLKTSYTELVEGKPIVVATLVGTEPELPSVLLNSHYDVVPAMEDQWTVDPWSAPEKDGKIYGRGTQDMKCVCAQYILALRRLLRTHKGFRRTLHLSYVPDEEIGGADGVGKFIESPLFKSLGTIGLALDEGLATPQPGKCSVFRGERQPLWVLVEAKGPTGHGSRFIANTAVEKLIGVSNKALEFRRAEEKKLGWKPEPSGCKHCEAKKLGDVTSLNITMLEAGVSCDGGKTFALNVIPTNARAGFDVRVTPNTPIEEITGMLDIWCADESLSWKFAVPPLLQHYTTSIDEKTNHWWPTFNAACKRVGLDVIPEIFPAATDSRYLRKLGIPAFGFSPMPGSPILLHEHDEYLDRDVFLAGIGMYEEIIRALANKPRHDDQEQEGAEPSSKRQKS